jgi:hypothetical protein
MKKLLTAMAVSALAAAAPAAAQYSNQDVHADARGGGSVETRIARLDARIEAGVRSGEISRSEARTLRNRLRDITRLERQYSRNGLSQQERADLRQRVRSFREELRMAGGYGNGQYGYGDREDDGYYGQGGPYEDIDCDNGGGGLGGIIDSIFGGGRDNDCARLRVGQRATGNLGAVPYEYRNQYRDGGGVYYRSDGRAIYQIDARTDTVIRIYNMNR